MAVGFSEGNFSDRPGLNEWDPAGGFSAGGEEDPGSRKGKGKGKGKRSSSKSASFSATRSEPDSTTERSEATTKKTKEQQDRIVALGDWLVSHDTDKKPDWPPKKGAGAGEKNPEPKLKSEDQSSERVVAVEEAADKKPEKPAESEDQNEQAGDDSGHQEDERDSKEGRGYDSSEWPAQGYVLPLDAVSGGESIDFILNLHTAEPPRPESEEEADAEAEEDPALLLVTSEEERGVESGEAAAPVDTEQDVKAVPVSAAGSHEQPVQQVHGYEVPALAPENPPVAPIPVTMAPEGVQVAPGNVPEASPVIEDDELEPADPSEPIAPQEELTDDIPELPVTTQYASSVEGGWNPAAAYRRYTERDVAARDGRAPDEQLVTKRELDNAVYYAAKTGQNRGVIAGALVGGLYEHFKHKRREKKTTKLIKQQNKQMGQMREDQHFYFTEQTRQQNESRRQLEATEQRAATVERQLREQRISERQTTERLITMREATTRQQTEAAKANEVPKEGVLEGSEQLVIPPEHVLQTSAWHSIEIDKRTGRPVETPTFMYGREYYRERAQEVGPVSRRNAAAGEVALVAASRGGAAGDDSGSGSNNGAGAQGANGPMSTGIPSATTQGPPVRQKAKDAASSMRDQLTASTGRGPVWPYLVALVVILCCLVALLH